MSQMSQHFLKSLFVVIISVISSISIYGSDRVIYGHVSTKNNEPIDAAAIKLFMPDSVFVAGTLTDSIGNFKIKTALHAGYLMVECLGYSSEQINLRSSDSDVDLGTVYLSETLNRLDEVTVMADRVVKSKYGLMIYPRKDDLKFATSGQDVLYNIMIPGINVNRQSKNITHMGEEVAVYINGRQASYSEVQNIPTQSIERVEYIDVPYGVYVNDNIAINIITKKEPGSLYLAIDGIQNLTYHEGAYNAMAQHTRNNLTFQIFGGYEHYNYNNNLGSTTDTYIIGNQPIEQNKVIEKQKKIKDSQYFQTQLISTSDNKSLSANLTFVREHEPDNITIENINGLHDNSTTYRSENIKPSLKLNGDFKLSKNRRISISWTNTYGKNRYSRQYEYFDYNTLTDVNENLFKSSVNANFTKRIQQNTLSISLLDSYTNSNSSYHGQSGKHQNLMSNELILQSGLITSFNKYLMLNTRVGCSLLTYQLKGTNSTNQLYPRINLMLRYTPSANNVFSLNFNTGNSFPSVNTLNDVVQSVNEYMIKKGNPDLKMSRLFNTAVMYNLVAKKINLQIMAINNIFTHLTLPLYVDCGDKVLYTFDSDSKLIQNIAVASGTYSVSRNLRFKGELAYIHSSFSGRYNNHLGTLRASFDANYILKNFLFNISLKTPEKNISNSGVITKDFIHYNANVRYTVNNWYFELGTVNLFSKKKLAEQNYTSAVYGTHATYYDRTQQSNMYVKVALNFNRGKEQKVRKTSIDKSIDSSIMKIQQL